MADTATNPLESMQALKTRLDTLSSEVEQEKATLDRLKGELDGHKTEAEQLLAEGLQLVNQTQQYIDANNLEQAQASNTAALEKKTAIETLLTTIEEKTTALETSANNLGTLKERAENLKIDVDLVKLRTKNLEPDIFNDGSTKALWQFNNANTPGRSGINGSYDAMSRFYSGFSDNNRELNTELSMTAPYYGMIVNLPATPFENVPKLTARNIALYKGLSQCDNTTSEQTSNPNRRLFSAARKPAIEDRSSWTLSFNYNLDSNANGGLDFLSVKNHFYTGQVKYVTNSGTTAKSLVDFSLHEQMFFTSRGINSGADANGVLSEFRDINTLPVLRIRLDAGFFNSYNGAEINAPYAGTNYKDLNLEGSDTVFNGITYQEAFTAEPVIDYVRTSEGKPLGAVGITKASDFPSKKLSGTNTDDPGAYYTYINVYLKKDAAMQGIINYAWTFNVENGKIAAYVDGVKRIEFHIDIKKGGQTTTYKPYFYNSFFASRAADFIPEVTRWPEDANASHTLTPARIIDKYVTDLPKEEDNDWYQDKIIFFRFPYATNINVYTKAILKDVRILNKIVSDKEVKSLASETLETNYDIDIRREKRIIYNVKPNIFRDGSDIAYAKYGEKPIIAKNWYSSIPAEESKEVITGYENSQPVASNVKSTADKTDFVHAKYPETTDFTISFVVDKDFAPESATALLVGMLGYSVDDTTTQYETWQGKSYPAYSVPVSAKAETYFELRYNNAVVGGMKYNTTDIHYNNCIAFPTGAFKTATTGEGGRILCALTINPGIDTVNITNRILKVFSPAVIGALYKPAKFEHAEKTVFTLGDEANTKLNMTEMSRSITGGGTTFIRPASMSTVFRHDTSQYNRISNLLTSSFEELSKPNNGYQYDNATNTIKNMTISVDNKKSLLFRHEVATSGTTPSEANNLTDIHLTTALYTNAIMNPSNTIYVPVYNDDAAKIRVTFVASVTGNVQTIKAYVGSQLRDSVVIGSPNNDSTEDYNGTINNKVALRLLPHKFENEVFAGKTPYNSTENHAKPFGPQTGSQFFYNANLENNQEDNGLATNKVHELSVFNRALSVEDIVILVDSDRKQPGELIYDVEVPAEAPIITSADVDIDGIPSYSGVSEESTQTPPKPTTDGNTGTESEYNPAPDKPSTGETQPQPPAPDTGDFSIKYNEGIPVASGTPINVASMTAGKKMKLTNVDLYFSVYSSSNKKYSMIHEHVDAVDVDLSQITQTGVYYIRRKQSSNVWEIISGMPVVGKTSTTGDYYLNGDWYNKSNQKQEPLTYLPFHLVVDRTGLKTVAYNLYSGLADPSVSVATLPEGEWFTMDNQRQWGVIYTNTTKYTMMVVVAGDAREELTAVVTRSNSIEAYTLKNEETLMFLVEPNERYKVTNTGGVTKRWQEFKRVN